MNSDISRGEIVLYQTADGRTSIDVKLENETVWLTQAQMDILFEKDQSVIARHIKNALLEGEIDESNMQILHNTLSRYKPTTVYNLDVIISVGYRVHSKRGVQFRRWANFASKDTTQKGMRLPALTWSPKKNIKMVREQQLIPLYGCSIRAHSSWF